VSEREVFMEKPLIIFIDRELLDNILNLLEAKDLSVLDVFKIGLIEGKIRVKNFDLIAERIIERYGEH